MGVLLQSHSTALLFFLTWVSGSHSHLHLMCEEIYEPFPSRLTHLVYFSRSFFFCGENMMVWPMFLPGSSPSVLHGTGLFEREGRIRTQVPDQTKLLTVVVCLFKEIYVYVLILISQILHSRTPRKGNLPNALQLHIVWLWDGFWCIQL